ncbi:MAG: hypothetical protein EBZ73_06475 [Burkholderiaceae bacterium]|nr:hypothetical protein [Burkholderiaceae bacterium]
MIKKLLLISLIALIPVQAWAVLDMSMQKQLVISVVETQESMASHPCHQDGKNAAQHSIDDQQVVEVSGDRCYSCTLCMAFGLLPNPVALVIADRYSQIFHTNYKILTGIDLAVVNKPPIL